MTLSHLHLILNHVPTVGSAVALALLLLAFLRRNDHLKIAGLEVLFLIAVLTLPVFFTGVGAQRELRARKAVVSDTAIREHEDVAIAGFAVTEFAGFVAWVALFQFRRMGGATRGLVPAVMVLLVIALVFSGRAANLGGEIRHPEMLTVTETETPALGSAPGQAEDNDRFVASRISSYMVNSPWAWPAAETVHFLGLSLSLGVLLAVNLRILGVMRRVPFGDIHRLLPWGLLGFGANLITGMLFLIAQPGQYVANTPFLWKVVLLALTGGNFLYLTVFTKAWRADAGLADKAMALSSIVAWLGILYAGRTLPYLGNAF